MLLASSHSRTKPSSRRRRRRRRWLIRANEIRVVGLGRAAAAVAEAEAEAPPLENPPTKKASTPISRGLSKNVSKAQK